MQKEDNKMDAAKIIKELREQTGMNRREFSEYTKIPVRTLEDWEAGKRTPPEYVPRLLNYQLMYDKLRKNNEVKEDELYEKNVKPKMKS
jgi:transcriptional regulator with XRE-family HTH domain